MIHNASIGIAALSLSMIQAVCAIALGLYAASRIEDSVMRISAALLAGAGVTATVLGFASWILNVRWALAIFGILSVSALVHNRRELARSLREVTKEVRGIAKQNVVIWWSFCAIFVFYWLNAIAPPRDGDVVRYHLTHIRQIARDGKWIGIADYHYALPFGWTFNYLPFEMARLPEAAHMLNMIVVFLVALGVLSVASRSTRFREISIVAMLFLLHPAVLKSGTTAFADAYAILAVFTATSLIASARDDESLSRAAFVAGLVSWIGIQSRYQLVAFGVAASLGFLFVWRSTRSSAGNLGRFALGAIAAGAMASPFYLMNLSVFGNPVWPFFAHTGANASYADLVGAAYHHSQTGAHSIAELMRGLGRLVTFRDMFPIPLVFALVAIAAWIRCKRERATLIIATSFALLWIIAQPALFPRFVLYLVPFVLLLAICLINSARGSSKIRVGFMTAALVLFAAADTVYSADNLKYDFTADTAAFHRYTWYFPVYQWVNSHTERDARFLVIVWSGYTYHLDRQYRRADPWLSGEMDWRRIRDARALDSAMTHGKFDYVIYDARSWKGMEGGENMMLAIDDAIRTGSLIPVRKFRERLYTSRINKSYHESDVYVLRRKGG